MILLMHCRRVFSLGCVCVNDSSAIEILVMKKKITVDSIYPHDVKKPNVLQFVEQHTSKTIQG